MGEDAAGGDWRTTRLIVGHGFEELGLCRISLEVHAFDPRARRVHEKVGLVAAGVLRDALRWEGERVDAAVIDWNVTARRRDRSGRLGRAGGIVAELRRQLTAASR